MSIVRYLRPHIPLGPTFPGGPYLPGRDYLLTQDMADNVMIQGLIKTGMVTVIANEISEAEEKEDLVAKAADIKRQTEELDKKLKEINNREEKAAKTIPVEQKIDKAPKPPRGMGSLKL